MAVFGARFPLAATGGRPTLPLVWGFPLALWRHLCAAYF